MFISSHFRYLHGAFRATTFITCVLLLSGCSIFGDEEEEDNTPTELVRIDATLDVDRIWSQKLGKGTEALRVGLSPGGDGNRVYAASHDGNVSAFNAENGKQVWRVKTGVILSAGPGVGEGIVVVAGYDGDLIVLNAADGSEVWRIQITSETLATPLVRDGNIAVYSIDGRLRVYSAFDGSETWALEQSSPALTQRGSANPIMVGTSILSGFDNGRLLAFKLSDGTTVWEAVLTPPAGRSDLDRLADVDGSIAVVGQDVYASGYNGRIASIAAESGEVLWDREISTHAGLSADWNNVYAVGDDGEVIALLRRNGTDLWRQESLLHRDPTPPVAYNTAIVVGDFEGYVHFFSNFDGQPVARERVGKGMISGIPLVMGDKLIVQSESGALAAFTVRTPKPKVSDSTEPDEET